MKFLLFVLVACAILLSDPFLVSLIPGITQGILIIPFMIYSLRRYKINFNDPFLLRLTIYQTIIFFFYLLSGLSDLVLFYNLIGTSLFGLALYNKVVFENYIKVGVSIFIVGTTIISLAFYLGFWEIELLSGRASYIKHNENMLAQLLCAGFSFSLFNYIICENKIQKRLYLLVLLMHFTPILATVSRTGITSLFISILLFSFAYSKPEYRTISAIVGIIILLISPFLINLALYNNVYLSQFASRTADAENDDRAELWSTAYLLIKNNLFSGIGFGNFSNENWRITNGLTSIVFNADGTTSVSAMSIHNSFIDFILIGGMGLLASFVGIIYYPIKKAIIQILDIDSKKRLISALVLSLMINATLFAFTGQGGTQKINWFLIGLSYGLVNPTYLSFILNSKKE